MFKFTKKLTITMSVMIITGSLLAEIIDVKTLGAKGDGKTDDTEAVQKAMNTAVSTHSGGVLYFPKGRYLISKTLKLKFASGLIIRGEGAMGYKADYTSPWATQSVLVWDGEDGGTLFHSHGCYGNNYENLAFSGQSPTKKDSLAGILFLMTTEYGHGNMIHRFSNLSFSKAKVGMQMGAPDTSKVTDSDLHLESIFFGGLETGFKSTQDQAVDYTFTFLFGVGVGTVFEFNRGGNVLVNSAQLTNCKTVLYVGWCGQNNGLFQLNNVRLEGGGPSLKDGKRWQLLRTGKNVGFAMIRFNNCCDAQWYWFKQDPQPQTPLCEVNAGAFVEFNNSVFQGPLATINGNDKSKARFVVRNSLFRYVTPEESVKANKNGFYKMTDNVSMTQELHPDYVKW